MKRIDVLNCWLVAAIAAVLLLGQVAQADQTWQDHAAIRAAAAQTVRAQWGVDGGRVDAVADELDQRVRLAACNEPLQVTVPFTNKNRRASRVTTEVRCRGSQPWKIYVPVRLAVFQPVVVAKRALPRDSLLTGDDISLAETDIGRLDYGFLSSPADAIGHRLRRPLAAGDVLTPANLETPALIQRGQRVTLEARSGGLTVRMAGVAKTEGIRGQIIEVENLGSGRDVQAIVRSAKSVEVLLQ